MTVTKTFDVVVLGGGIGGYVCAIRAAQLGKTVAIVEKDKLGGTCLHRGCIPTKSLLRSAEVFAHVKEGDKFGISVTDAVLDFGKVQQRKASIVSQLHKGLQFLMKKNKIEVIYGKGTIMGPSIFSPKSGSVGVETLEGEMITLICENLVIATGSRPSSLPGLETDGKVVLNSDEALEMEALPSSILIIGGGVIGVEWASMLNDFGVQVTLVEAAERILPMEDEDISRELSRLLEKRGVHIFTNAKVLPETASQKDGEFFIEAEQNGGKVELRAEKVLVCVGRTANVDGIGLEKTDIQVERGVIQVNEYMQTSESHIYAVGDVNGGLQLAHAAAHEGMVAAEHLAGLNPFPIERHRVPRCVYSRPEVASVGWTEREAKELGYEVKVGKFPFKALGKALVFGDSEGFAKVVADGKTDDILGVHLIGPHVTEHISEASLAKLLEASPWEVSSAIHPHPTLSEALAEAMLQMDGKSINL